MPGMSRRKMLELSSLLTGAVALGVPFAEPAAGEEIAGERRKLKVVVAGAHPDDPESGCGGTILRYTNLGHEVVIIYLTRGEAGINGKTHAEAATIRTAEARKACEILKARPVFAGQIDGDTEVSHAQYEKFTMLLNSEQPDIVFTHWPIDSHPDHRAASLLTYEAWLRGGKKYPLFYFEVMQGTQTQNFGPTHYVNISETEKLKRAACFAHTSQQPEKFYAVHNRMNSFRGLECGCGLAEAFIRHNQSPHGLAPDI